MRRWRSGSRKRSWRALKRSRATFAKYKSKGNEMSLNVIELHSDASIEIFELSADEQEHVAGGPEVENDPGQ